MTTGHIFKVKSISVVLNTPTNNPGMNVYTVEPVMKDHP